MLSLASKHRQRIWIRPIIKAINRQLQVNSSLSRLVARNTAVLRCVCPARVEPRPPARTRPLGKMCPARRRRSPIVCPARVEPCPPARTRPLGKNVPAGTRPLGKRCPAGTWQRLHFADDAMILVSRRRQGWLGQPFQHLGHAHDGSRERIKRGPADQLDMVGGNNHRRVHARQPGRLQIHHAVTSAVTQ